MPAQVETLALSSELLKIVPVVSGAFLAIIGGILSQVVTYRLNGKREHAKLMREKLEVFVQSLYEHSDWLDEKRNKLVYSDESHDVPSPLDKAMMQQRLYFPELGPALSGVVETALPLVLYFTEQRVSQLKDRRQWLNTHDTSVHNEMYKKYRVSLEKAFEQAARLSSKYIRT
ncbi:hypothetical protein KTQ42_08850|uniref:hypothetical protein n=1 Tax=Noviherbaspirillum sp. L7-7A TaxID=2850560 RepID=UPI001C2CAF15|nr:hypothetical protein [Noviherbaspirillum sp. L7-7A]MBV0879410.1 hypothetical protein [Noviherbaspirillum sp. L7-7A]